LVSRWCAIIKKKQKQKTKNKKNCYCAPLPLDGGPHVQYVCNSWSMTVDMRSQYLRSQGFLVIKVDNRGSNRRGLVFEAPIRRSMGSVEVADQVAGVEWAADVLGLGDKARVAVSGWSYGGYMALKCLCGRPDIFHAGISGAPVTDWALYDTVTIFFWVALYLHLAVAACPMN
jgi:dipeptidyl aminopeptidase/acylaminoacyl peptidase